MWSPGTNVGHCLFGRNISLIHCSLFRNCLNPRLNKFVSCDQFQINSRDTMAESLDLSIQSRRFQCVYQHGGSLIAAFNLLKSLPTVSFASRSDRVVYMETVSKRRISFFSSMSDLFLDAECVSHCSMKAEDVIESFGKAMRAAARAQGNQPQHLVSPLLKRRRSLHVNVRFEKCMWMFKWYVNTTFIFGALFPLIQCPFRHILF
jgi:hypothetical protein